jgi:Holliday junction DNA helicase RuvA
LLRVLADDDLAALCLVPGVGKKTAARLLVELKSRLDVPGLDAAALASSDGGEGRSTGAGRAASPVADVRDALTNLGYGPDEVAEAVRDLPDDADSSELLRLALQKLAAA